MTDLDDLRDQLNWAYQSLRDAEHNLKAAQERLRLSALGGKWANDNQSATKQGKLSWYLNWGIDKWERCCKISLTKQ